MFPLAPAGPWLRKASFVSLALTGQRVERGALVHSLAFLVDPFLFFSVMGTLSQSEVERGLERFSSLASQVGLFDG